MSLAKVLLALVVSVVGFMSEAKADSSQDGWAPRLSCAQGQFVVDGYHTDAHGFTSYQIVVRDPSALQHFADLANSVAPVQLPLNAKSEWVIPMRVSDFDGSLDQLVLDMSSGDSSSGGNMINLRGHWLDGGRYDVEMTSLSVYPGMTYHDATVLGDWVFNGCETLR